MSVVCVVLKYFITPLAVLDSFTTHLALESVTSNSMVILYHNSVGFSMIQYGCVCEQYGSVLHSIFCKNWPYHRLGISESKQYGHILEHIGMIQHEPVW